MESLQTVIKKARPIPRPYTGSAPKNEPVCQVCGGFGLVRPAEDYEVSDPNFGKLKPCPECLKTRKINSGLTDMQSDFAWDEIIPARGIQKAVDAVKEALRDHYGWVYLHGSSGLAKSLILQIAIAETVREGKDSRYVNMIDILDSLRTAFDTDNPSSEEVRRLEMWSELPLLAIDEFDRINNTEWASNRKFQLIDRRYVDAVEGKSVTLLSSNSDPEKFPEYIRSRIFDGRFKVIPVIGADYRKNMNRK